MAAPSRGSIQLPDHLTVPNGVATECHPYKVGRDRGMIVDHLRWREVQVLKKNPRLRSLVMRLIVLGITLATGIAVSIAWKSIQLPGVSKRGPDHQTIR